MTITITAVRLRRLWHFFPLTWHGFKITMQTRKSSGFIKMKNTGMGYWHYTMTAWESEEAMKNFMRSGAHGQAMKDSAKLATTIGSYTYEGEDFPTWKEAKELVKQGHFNQY